MSHVAEADGLREDGGGAGKGDAVKTFVPPVVGGDVEARDGRCNVLHLEDFFVGGEAGDEVVDALVNGEGRIEVGRRGGLGESENRDGEECEEDEGQGFHAGIVAKEEVRKQGKLVVGSWQLRSDLRVISSRGDVVEMSPRSLRSGPRKTRASGRDDGDWNVARWDGKLGGRRAIESVEDDWRGL